MISAIEGFNIKLTSDFPGVYSIFTWERIVIGQDQIMNVKLPYRRLKIDNKFYNFTLDKKLVQMGLSCLYYNLNDMDSVTGLDFIIKNNNIDKDMNSIQSICGAGKRIDIRSGDLFGRIFC
jgi:hypothetical protein